MTTYFRRIKLAVLLAVTCLCCGEAMAADGFRAVLLGDMAQSMGMTDSILGLDEGDHVARFSYKDKPVTVSVRNGAVTHIGYAVFSAPHREAAYTPAFDVVERLALLNVLKLDDKRSALRMLTDVGGDVRKGSLAMLPKLYGDTLMSVSVRNIDGKLYRLRWARDGKDVVDIVIPYTYSLLHGTDMEEDEENLVRDLEKAIATADTSMFVATTVTRDDLLLDFPTWRFILPGDAYYFDSFNSNRYYTKVDSVTFAPIFDERFPVESMANVVNSMEVPNDLSVSLKIIRYNYKNTTMDIPLSVLVKYCLDNGCRPYFGLISMDSECKQFMLLMRNEAEGYCHIIKIVANTPEGKPYSLIARLNPYIPISKIVSLFADSDSATVSSHKNRIKYRRK